MAYLNADQRDQLRNDLLKLKFGKARGRLRGMDPKGSLRLYRNMQSVGRWYTTYELPTCGVLVSLIETSHAAIDRDDVTKREYEFVDVIVEPTAENGS